jgi:hypothetical protein
MFIFERLTSRSSVALSVSIGYARAGGGWRAATRSRGPDDDVLTSRFAIAFSPSAVFPRNRSPQPTACVLESQFSGLRSRPGE